MEDKGQANNAKPTGNRLKEFFQLGEVAGYFFRKKDPTRPNTFNIRAMHTINKISILIFLVCLLIILKRYIFGY
ncbi:MAG: hypothetical protein KF725_05260 [Cyclobacteriaceae bacterium]|nr:hypothetical protein [Cyclobacteriaceae bacterium]UYN85883.1 MAG: hypothetical protein KIT51_13540 [Cyclobacteriaceae bacterium]